MNPRLLRILRLLRWTNSKTIRVFVEVLTCGVMLLNVLIIEMGGSLWQLNFFIFLSFVGVTGWRWGVSATARKFEKELTSFSGNLPKGVAFQVDEETGVRTALVNKNNGEIAAITLPEGISGPHEAMDYILHQLLGDPDVQVKIDEIEFEDE